MISLGFCSIVRCCPVSGAAAAWITLVLFRYVERIMPSEVYETITVRTTDVETGFSRVRTQRRKFAMCDSRGSHSSFISIVP